MLCCLLQTAYSQVEDGVVALDIPIRNSLTFNRFAVSPTFSFVREQNKYITATNKRELIGVEDAPLTYFFSYSGRIKENIGAGIGVFQQNYGVLTTFGGIINFAYNVRIEEDSNFSFGLNVGAYKSGLNTGNVNINFDDPALNNIPSNFLFTANPGLNYGTGFIDFGISYKNLITYNINSSAMVEENPIRGLQGHIMYTGYFGGYGFFGDSKFSALARAELQNEDTIFTGNAMLTVNKGLWAQFGYSTKYGGSAGLGINITSQIAIEYNYEKPFNELTNLGSSHEITLAYRFKNNNYYDYSSDDELAGLFTFEKQEKKKKTIKTSENKTAEVEVNLSEEEENARLAEEENARGEENARIEAEEENARIVAEEQARLLAEEEKAKLVAEENARIEAEENARIEAEENARKEAVENARLIAEEQARLLAEEEKAKLVAEENARIEAEENARIEAEENARLIAEEQARLLAEEENAKLVAEENARIEAEENARLIAEEQARLLAEEEKAKLVAEENARLLAEEQARLLAEEEKAKLAEEENARIVAEEQAKLDEEKKAKELLIQKPLDNIGKSMSELTIQSDESIKNQDQLLKELEDAVAIKEQDLKDLKEENDLSEQNIYVAPKAFKSISKENKAIELVIINLDTVILRQKKKITLLESLLKERVITFKDPNDETNLYYRNKITQLKLKQEKTIERRETLITSLKDISTATDFERKRRIKRAAYNNVQDRYTEDRNKLNSLRESVPLKDTALDINEIDFGRERNNNIQILKNVPNTENGYYLVLAVHNNIIKRDEFLVQVISSGYKDVDFFFDVNTSEYYIYSKRFDNINETERALASIEDEPYNIMINIIKIEN